MTDNNVLVVGTGTIGEPLTGLLSVLRKELGIDNVLFYKHTPRLIDRPLVKGLIRKGGHLVYDPKVIKEGNMSFKELDLEPEYTWEEALKMATVVIDCTKEKVGLRNKKDYYLNYKNQIKGFLAQGSEHGFGTPFATGVNNKILAEKAKEGEKFFQVVSCNTHVLSAILRNVAMTNNERYWPIKSNHFRSRFVIMRRATDISQAKNFVQAPTIAAPDDDEFGSHHAKDVYHLYKTLGHELDLYSTAIKLNTPFMHTVHFSIETKNVISKEEVINSFLDDPLVAVTNKKTTNQVFSVGREHGFYGRILDQAVIVLPSLHVRKLDNGSKSINEVTGIAFTPQDGNSLLSSVTASLNFIYDHDFDEVENRLKCLEPYQFDEV